MVRWEVALFGQTLKTCMCNIKLTWPIPSTNTIPTVKYSCGIIMQWGCFSSAGTESLVRVEGKMNGHRYCTLLQENLLQMALNLRLKRRFAFQHDSYPKHKPETKAQKQKGVCLEWPSQSPDFNPTENLWHYLKKLLSRGAVSKT